MKKYDLVLQGGRVVDPAGGVDDIADVAIRGGSLEEVGASLNCLWSERVIDVTGKLVIPGVIDSHAHVVRPGSGGAAYNMLVRAGVTTVADFSGPMKTVLKEMSLCGNGLNVMVLEALCSECLSSGRFSLDREVSTFVEKSLEEGALGVKLLGGHHPLRPETMAAVIEECDRQKCYVAVHAGSSTEGSDIRGMEQAINLADGRPLHVAHVNSYCRGLVEDPLTEVHHALDLLRRNPGVVSESYLAVNNGTSAIIGSDGRPESRVTCSCLRRGGYPQDEEGMEAAIAEGYASIYALVGGEMRYLPSRRGLAFWRENDTVAKCSFSVNIPSVLVACATAKDDRGRFIVPAISSDGGGVPRNVILKNGLDLVDMGSLSLMELVEKVSLAPARMFGLKKKGRLSPGSDADLAVVDPVTGEVSMTIISGRVVMAGGACLGGPGRIITTARGVEALAKQNVSCEVVDLEDSFFRRGRNSFEK